MPKSDPRSPATTAMNVDESLFAERAAGPARACWRVEHIYTPARARPRRRWSRRPSQRSSRAPALDCLPARVGETGVPRSDPTVLLGWSWSRAACSFSARGRRVDQLSWRFCAQRRQPRRRQVCARRDALSSWHEVRRPLTRRPGPSTRARDRRLRSVPHRAPPVRRNAHTFTAGGLHYSTLNCTHACSAPVSGRTVVTNEPFFA